MHHTIAGYMFPGPTPPLADTEDATAEHMFHKARDILLNDGYHSHHAMLLRERCPVGLLHLAYRNNDEKQTALQGLARIVSATGANAVITTFESRVSSTPDHAPSTAPARRESLIEILASASQPPVMRMANIARDRDNVSLEDTITDTIHYPALLAPVYRTWNIPVPDHASANIDIIVAHAVRGGEQAN